MQAITNLYSKDNRYGDCLVEPLRICGRQWAWLKAPLNPLDGKCWQVAKRVALVFPLMIATIVSATLSVPGICMKALQRRPADLDHNEIETATPTAMISSGGTQLSLPHDIVLLIAAYLGATALDGFRHTCLRFNVAGRTIFLQRSANELRLAGLNLPTASSKRPTLRAQIETYRTLKKERAQKDAKDRRDPIHLMDYFSRLMPGGPIAFRDMPIATPKDATKLTTIHVPVVRGTDRLNRLFIAFNLKVTTAGQSKIMPLVFVYMPDPTQIGSERWIQQANELLPRDRVRLACDSHIRMALHLLQGQVTEADQQLFQHLTGVSCEELQLCVK